MAKEMGLDRAPIEFRKLVFLVPPTTYYVNDKGGFLSCLPDTGKTNDTEKTLLTF